MSDFVKYPGARVQLTGEDGNVFSILGRVRRAIREVATVEEADAFVAQAMALGNYDEVLQLVMATVETS